MNEQAANSASTKQSADHRRELLETTDEHPFYIMDSAP